MGLLFWYWKSNLYSFVVLFRWRLNKYLVWHKDRKRLGFMWRCYDRQAESGIYWTEFEEIGIKACP